MSFPLILTFVVGLVLHFCIIYLLAATELAQRRKQQAQALELIATQEVKFYPATIWYLQNKWLTFTRPIALSMLGIGGLMFWGFISGGATPFAAFSHAGKLITIAILYFVLPITIVHYFFGGRIGLSLLCYAEYGITKEGLLYCPFTHWYLIPWEAVQGIRPMKSYMGTVHCFHVDIKDVITLPNWYKRYLWGNRAQYPLILHCLLPGVLTLKQEIEQHIQH